MKLVVDTTEALGRRGRIIGWFRPKGQPSPQPIDPAEVIHDVNEGFSVPDPDLPSWKHMDLTDTRWITSNVPRN